MHFFSNPRNPNEIGSSGKGMEGDYEFLIMESSAEKVILEGRKTKNRIIMTPLQAGINWSDYLKGIQKSSTTLDNISDAVITIGDKVLDMEQGLRQFSVSYTENDTLYSKKLPYVVTSKGVKFYDSPTLLGKTLDEFVFSEDKRSLTSPDGSAVIEFLFTPFDINGKKWDIIVDANNVSDSFNSVFQEIKTKNIEVYEETLEPLLSLGLYRSADGEPGISFFSTTSENKTYRSLHGLKFKGVPGYPDNLAVIAGRTDLFNWSFYTHLLPMVTAITDNSPYKTELNNETDPNVVKLISTKNANFWFILRR